MKTHAELKNELHFVKKQIENCEIEIEHYRTMVLQWNKRRVAIWVELTQFEEQKQLTIKGE